MSDVAANRVKIGGDRHYQIGGNTYPSVTTVIPYTGKKVGDDYLRYTQIRGTLVHHRVLNPLAIRQLPLPEVDMSVVGDQLRADIETALVMWDELDYEVEDSPHVERMVWSDEHGYAGTLDLLNDGEVVDLKTSPGVYKSHKMQAAAYWHACHERPKMPNPDSAAIIGLHPDPSRNKGLKAKKVELAEGQLHSLFSDFLEHLSEYE